MLKTPESLTKIFATTDTVEYGPFKITKKTGEEFSTAVMTVNDVPVTLKPAEKMIMALLICQKGQDFTITNLAESLESPKYSAILREMQDITNPKKQREAIMDLKSAFKVHISHIRSAISKAFDNEKDQGAIYRNMIRSLTSRGKAGNANSGHEIKEGGYRLEV